MLLPDGTLKISTIDKGILVSTASVAAFGILAKTVTVLAGLEVSSIHSLCERIVLATCTGIS